MKTCGSCYAGIIISEVSGSSRIPDGALEIERCDECNLFASDDDAAFAALNALLSSRDGERVLVKALRKLHKEYRGIETTDTPVAAGRRLWRTR